MIVGFIIVSIVAIVFSAIGMSCRKADEAVGFFTFTKPPTIENVKSYNRSVSVLWFVAAGVIEILGIPMLFLEQNSPFFIIEMVAVMILIIIMMVAYIKIEAKYQQP